VTTDVRWISPRRPNDARVVRQRKDGAGFVSPARGINSWISGSGEGGQRALRLFDDRPEGVRLSDGEF
jgi:hypothetical protein